MVSLSTIGGTLVDWTDPRKCYSAGLGMDAEKKNVNGDVHLDFAHDILERLEGNASSKLNISMTMKAYQPANKALQRKKRRSSFRCHSTNRCSCCAY